jgi:precorrin-2 dehydrogenase/sirohydrochlorin ferrochelatase
MKTYPICLVNLSEQRTVVIGGGQVALRKVRGLLEAGASITLISRNVIPELKELAQTGLLKLIPRDYQRGDLQDTNLVIAATDDPQVNHAIWEEAQQVGCLINVVDDPAHCNFILPAVVQRGDFSIAISTGGASPMLARRTRERLEAEYGSEMAEYTALLGEIRPTLLDRFPSEESRRNAAMQLIDSNLMDVLKEEGYEKAKHYALEIIKPISANG